MRGKSPLGCVVGLLVLSSFNLSAVDYSSIPVTGVVVTGVRSTSSTTDDVVLTASYVDGGITYAGLYTGSLANVSSSTSSDWVRLTPSFAGQTVTSATFYGPNTSLFTPSIGAGNVIAVGSYKTDATGVRDLGMMYEGPVTGVGGTWTELNATPLLSDGETLLNTIAHSNMGDLVVGNYDTDLATGNAFIYNRATDTWLDMNPGGSASVTAYGIWQNSATSYTIAGGLSDLNSGGIDEGYLVNFDSSTELFSDYKTFNFNNAPVTTLISHFDGITVTETGFNLTGDYLTTEGGLGAFFASVPVLPEGGFGPATWVDISYPGSEITSGNTVVGNTVLGVYTESGGGGGSYVAVVPEPTTGLLLGLGGALLAAGSRRRARK